MPAYLKLASAACIAAYLAYSGVKKKSLSKGGAAAAFFVGFFSFLVSARHGFTMIAFYKSSSILTKAGHAQKKLLADDYQEGGQRSAWQVLSCSLFATLLALYGWLKLGMSDAFIDFRVDPLGSGLLCAYVAFYATCNGDTWSSELGILSRSPPRLILPPFRSVPRGTNGGVSALGTVAAAAGGLFIGLAFFLLGVVSGCCLPGDGTNSELSPPSQLPLLALGALSGLLGSVLDSAMGAILQASYYSDERHCIVSAPTAAELKDGAVRRVCGRDWLTNQQVNAISAVVVSVAGGLLARRLFPG
ncbi:unnamed protein product [Phaeothamnion confervicola]